MAQLARIPERHATFQEEKRIAALTQPLLSRGWLLYVRPAHLEKATTAPVPEDLVVDGDRLTIDSGDGRQTLSLESHPEIGAMVAAIRGTLAGDLAELRRYYTVEAQGAPEAWRLALRPASAQLARFVREITIAGTGTALRSVLIVQANGDTQRMTVESAP